MTMIQERAAAVINPVAGGGKARSEWQTVRNELDTLFTDLTPLYTEHTNHAESLVKEAVGDGATEILAVGGDGTVSEVVNGLLSCKPGSSVTLTVIPLGTGGDFRKSLLLPTDPSDLVKHLRDAPVRAVDAGKITFIDWQENQQTRHFVNIASFGLSGHIDKAVNQATWQKRLGGRFTFAWFTVMASLRYQPQKIRLYIDDDVDELPTFTTIAVCNGRYFGGGMKFGPTAELDDGLFDIVSLGPQSFWSGLRESNKLYKGTHIDGPNVFSWKGKHIRTEPADGQQEILLDIDGEPLGKLPAEFEILPAALNVRF